MTPRKPVKTDPITWEGIELAIQTYDRDWIIPRQDKIEAKRDRQHSENTAELEKLSVRVGLIEKLISKWEQPVTIFMRVVIIALTAILLGVIALVFDFVKWGLSTHWKW